MNRNFENHDNMLHFLSKGFGMFKEFKGGSGKNLFQNFISLSILQGANYVLPLIILPYLISVIGVEKFGLIVFAQAVIQYFAIGTDFGFNLSATQDIATSRDNQNRISDIFNSVLIIKFILSIISFGILYGLTILVGKFKPESAIYLLTFGVVIGNLLFPVWFFQGMEKMKYITILGLIGKIIYLILLLSFVRTESDYLLVPLFNSIGVIVAGLISLTLVFYKFNIKFVIPKYSVIINQFKRSSQFFLSRVSVSMYSSLNTLALGFFTTDIMVGYYAAAEKIFMAARSLFSPLVLALYPYMTSKRNLKLFKNVFYISIGIAVFLSISLFFFSDKILELIFKPDMDLSAEILRLFSLIIPIIAASVLLGYPLLAARGHEKYANFSIAIGSLIHIILIALLIPDINPVRVAIAVMITETVILGIIITGIRKHNLWSLE